MTDYNAIGAAEIAVDAALKATTMQKLRDNPIAIAEGQPSAPRVQMQAINGMNMRRQFDGSAAEFAGEPVISSNYVAFSCLVVPSGNFSMSVHVSSNGGSTYPYSTVVTSDDGVTDYGNNAFVTIDMASGHIMIAGGVNAIYASGITDINAVKFTTTDPNDGFHVALVNASR